MKKNLRKVLSVLVALVLFLQCTPLAALAEIIVESSSSVRLIQPDTQKYLTYKFVVDGSEVDTQIVKNGDTLLAPASPEKTGYKFLGWSVDADAETPVIFDGFGPVGEIEASADITLEAVLKQVYYVFFMDLEGRVCATKEGVSGQEIAADVKFPVDANEAITGWYTDSSLDAAYEVSSVTLEDKNITLYPEVEKGHWITFDSAEGSYIAPVFVGPEDLTAAPAAPTRTGFTFENWYETAEDGTLSATAFSFGGNLTENITLTAKWTGNEGVKYTVIHWQENVDDTNFSFVEHEEKTGTAGTDTAAAAKSYSGFTAVTDATDETYGKYAWSQQTIAGDGSTIVNIYYTRNVYTIYFWDTNGGATTTYSCGKSEHTHNWECCSQYHNHWDRNAVCDTNDCDYGYEHTHSDACSPSVDSSNALFTITAKHGAYIGDKWPSRTATGTNWSTNSDGSSPWQAGINTMPIGGDEFWVPSTSGNTAQSASYYTEVLDTQASSDTTVNGVKYDLHHTDTVKYDSGLTVSSEDFYDILGFTKNDGPSTDNGSTYNGAKFYYLRNDYTIQFINGGSVVNTVTKQYEAAIADTDVAITPSRPEGIPATYTFQGWYDNELCEGEAYVFPETMPAKSITVYAKWAAPIFEGTIHLTMEGNGKTKTIDIPYGSKIDEDSLPSLEELDIPEGSEWRGWATKDGDDYFPFNFNTLIYGDITLYPYYTSNQSFSVKYVLGEGATGTVEDTKKYAEDSYADIMPFAGATAPAGKVFLHWATEENGGGTVYYPNQSMKMRAEDVTLYAVYGDVPATTSITYYANNGTDASKTVEEQVLNGKYTIDGNSFSYTGYKFVSWNTQADGKGTSYAPGTEVRLDNNGDNKLYAIWEPDIAEYVVHHYLKGTTTQVAADVTGTYTIGKTYTASAATAFLPGFAGLTADEATKPIEIQLDATKNVITFYYTAALTITAGSAEKVYDGKALTQPSFTAEGLVNDDTTDKLGVVMTADSTITNVGTKANEVDVTKVTIPGYYTVTYVPGTLKVTKVTQEIVITADSNEQVYNGQALSDNGYTYTGTLAEGDKLTAVVEGTITNVGSADNVVTSYKVENATGEDVTAFYTFGTSVKGTLTVTPAPLTITTPDANKEYDGEALTAEGSISGFVNNETATFTTTGSQTEVGSSKNTYSLEWDGTATEGNYTISATTGTLTVTANTDEIVVKANDSEKVYDGVALTQPEATVTGVPEGFTYKVTTKGSITNVGTTANEIDTFVILDATGKDVTAQFSNITKTPGTLEVTKRAVTFTGESATKTYTGEAQEITGIEANLLEGFDYAGLTYSAKGTTVGEYDGAFSGEVVIKKGEEDVTSNFEITQTPGALTIVAADTLVVKVTGNVATKVYNGEEQEVTGFTSDAPATVTVELAANAVARAAGTNVGKYPMGLKAEDFVASSENYAKIVIEIAKDGELEITPITDEVIVNIAGNKETRVYDGEMQVVTGYEVTAISHELYAKENVALAEGKYAKAEGGSVGEYPMNLTPEHFVNTSANFTNVKFVVEDGLLTITPIAAKITITAASDVKVYDGTALINAGYTYTEGVLLTEAGDRLEVTVSGTITDVGEVANVVTSYKVMTGERDVTANYTFGEPVDGVLKVTPRTVTLTSATDNKEYDGEPLTNDTVTVTGDGFVEGEGATYNVTGSQTLVGSSPNAFTYTLNGNTEADNYTIETKLGTLTVKDRTEKYAIEVVANSGEYTYDGTDKTVEGFKTLTFEVEGNTYTVEGLTAAVTETNAGTYANAITGTEIVLDENGNDVTAQFDVTKTNGQLVIKPIDVTVTIVGNNATNVYDGTEHKVEGYTATANTELYDVENDFTFSGTAEAKRTEEGTTNMNLAAGQFTNTNSNFATVTFNVTDGYQTITPVDEVVVTIVGNTATNEYDGNEHKITGYTATANNDLYDVTKDFTFSGTAEAARTEVGTTYMGLVDTQFANTNGNFSKVTFVVTDGYQTITPVDDEVVVTIVGKNNTAAYDGAEHTVTGYDVTEISNSLYQEADFVFNGTAEAKRTDAGTTNMGLAADQFENTNDNFANVSFNVIDGYQTITPIDVTVTIVGANNTTEYDGVEHEVSGYTATANTELYDVTKDFTFSGTAVAARTDVGQTDMSLAADQFANTNSNFATVTFEVTDGYQKITPVAEEVVVTIVGKNNTTDYDGTEHGVNGYDVTNISNELYTAADFSFSGTAEAKRTDAGQTDMGLNAEQFNNTNANFSKVTFQVTDGYQKINPIDVTVTIVGNNATNVYDGTEHKVEGYTATADTKLYDVTKDFTFSGNAVAARTEEGTTNMGLKAEQFANTNDNFATVTFNVTDGYQTITPMTDEVVVTIVGNNVTKTYDGVEYVASGYEVTNISNSLYTEADFVFNGTAEAKRTDVGTTEMGLAAEQFKNTSADFANVKFVVTDGYVTINPRPITVIAASDEKVYDATALTNGNYLVLDGTYAAAPESATFDQDGETIVKKITATVSGSQTLVGESANTVATVTIDGTQYAATAEKFGNYAVTFIAGILAVTDEDADDDLVVNKTHEDKEYALGETVTFTITVKNIYAEAKTITITEKTGVTLVGGTDGKLVIEDVAPGAEVTATATYVITSDDILAGTFVNEVEVSFDGGSTFGDEDPVDPEAVDTTLTVEKTSDTEGKPVVLDQVITYTIKVTNDGNVPFYNVKVTDEWTKDNWTIAELKVGETKEFTATYTVTSDDILAGKVVNEVVAKGNPVKDPEGGEKTPEGKDDVTDTSDELDTTLDVEKTSDKEGQKVELGEKITYTITVTNKGNVPFYNVKVVDELVGLEETIAELKVGATETFTATYTVTSDDILAGEVINSVTATADPVKDPDGEDKIPADDDEITDEPGDLNTALEVVKTSDVAEGETVSLGDTITYTIKVTNKGNVPFYNVEVVDELTKDSWTLETLAVGESKTFNAEYTVVEDDIKAGSVINEVVAKGDEIDDPKKPDEPKKPEGEDDVEDPTDEINSTYTVVKDRVGEPANGEFYELGEIVNFEITVTNTGNVTVKDIVVKEELEGALFENGTDEMTIESLPPFIDKENENIVKFKATYKVTEDDLGNKDLANTLSVTSYNGTDPDPEPEPFLVDEVTSVTVTKVWDDLNNKYNTRAAVTVKLMEGEGENRKPYAKPGEDPMTAVIAEDEDGNWNSVTFEKLPVHKNGEEIVYTVEEVAVPGYDATYANDGNSWTITNTLQQYTLTIRHWIHFVDGEVAAPNYERTVYYGESYSVRSPNVKGFWPNPRYTTGIVTGNMVHDVIYDELDFTLTVQYVYQNGATAAPTHVQKKLHYGDDYRVVSPKLEGYVASYPEISGYMGTRDLSFTVIYVPENTIIIDEYGVPLGLGNVEMNVGECFE